MKHSSNYVALDVRHAATHEVPPRILVPLLNAASFEDDADLQDRWAALLAHAATEIETRH